MSTNKKYYFLKLQEDFFRDEAILLIEDVKDGFLFTNILLKMYLLAQAALQAHKTQTVLPCRRYNEHPQNHVGQGTFKHKNILYK